MVDAVTVPVTRHACDPSCVVYARRVAGVLASQVAGMWEHLTSDEMRWFGLFFWPLGVAPRLLPLGHHVVQGFRSDDGV